jgi:DNA-directed RNA polymerase subunit M/transcription elongation factor TFIIS
MNDRIPYQRLPSQQPQSCAITEAACPNCRVLLYVYKSRVIQSSRKRYYKCKQCGYRPVNNCEVVSLSVAPPQPKRKLLYHRGT